MATRSCSEHSSSRRAARAAPLSLAGEWLFRPARRHRQDVARQADLLAAPHPIDCRSGGDWSASVVADAPSPDRHRCTRVCRWLPPRGMPIGHFAVKEQHARWIESIRSTSIGSCGSGAKHVPNLGANKGQRDPHVAWQQDTIEAEVQRQGHPGRNHSGDRRERSTDPAPCFPCRRTHPEDPHTACARRPPRRSGS